MIGQDRRSALGRPRGVRIDLWLPATPRASSGLLDREAPGGFEFTFRDVLAEAGSTKAPPDTVTAADQSRVLRRAARAAAVTNGARILWVDDKPAGNLPERKVLRSLGIMIDLARSSSQGTEALGRADYDLVITNMHRDGSPTAGQDFLSEIRKTGHREPLVFYIMRFKPERGTPGDAIGITNRPDELVHLVLDGLERVRA
jgi:CheY-like chemotaxis protein